MSKANSTREPLLHIAKRNALPWYRTWGIRILSVVAAAILCAIVAMVVTGMNPLVVFATLGKGALGSPRKIWNTLQDVSILLIISLALTPAFKMRFWNIGGEGQVLIGGLAAAAVMLKLGPSLPNAVCILLMTIAAVAAGAVWAVIPALFKAKWNTNETLSTLMMNYIATQLVAYFIIVWVPNGSNVVGIINQNSEIGWLPQIYNKYLLMVIVAVLVTAGMYIYLNYTKHGYEISVVGESERTAKYIGIKVPRVIIRTMLLSGALCGLAGLLLVGGINHTIASNLVGGQGFTAVMVSWLAKFNPFAMILTSFLVVFMDNGASQIATTCGLNESFADILTGIIIFFIIGSEFFLRYKVIFRSSKAGSGKEVA